MMASPPDDALEALLEASLTAPVYEVVLAQVAPAEALALVGRCVRSLDRRERYHHEAAESLARVAARHLTVDRDATLAWLGPLAADERRAVVHEDDPGRGVVPHGVEPGGVLAPLRRAVEVAAGERERTQQPGPGHRSAFPGGG